MGFWGKLSDFAANPLGENSGTAKTLRPVTKFIRKTAPDSVDTRFVQMASKGTRKAGEKSPLISKDPILRRQEKDTSGDPSAPSGTQMQHKLGAAASIAATVYGVGAMSGGEAGAVEGGAGLAEAGGGAGAAEAGGAGLAEAGGGAGAAEAGGAGLAEAGGGSGGAGLAEAGGSGGAEAGGSSGINSTNSFDDGSMAQAMDGGGGGSAPQGKSWSDRLKSMKPNMGGGSSSPSGGEKPETVNDTNPYLEQLNQQISKYNSNQGAYADGHQIQINGGNATLVDPSGEAVASRPMDETSTKELLSYLAHIEAEDQRRNARSA